MQLGERRCIVIFMIINPHGKSQISKLMYDKIMWLHLQVVPPHDATVYQCPGQVLDGSPCKSPKKVIDVSPVLEWLRNLGLAKYEEVFVREEIDWDTLKWLTEEVCSILLIKPCLFTMRKVIYWLWILG